MYLVGDKRMGEAVAPEGRCSPIMLVLCLIRVVLGGTNVMHGTDCGKESLCRSLSMSSMEQVGVLLF